MTVDDATHNENFKQLRLADYSHPGKNLRDLVGALNCIPIVFIQDAHTFWEKTYEDLESADRENREICGPLLHEPPFPRNLAFRMDSSMAFYMHGYAHFVIKKSKDGHSFKDEIDLLVQRNPKCYVLPRSHWEKDNYRFDENYAFIVEFMDPSIRSVYPQPADGTCVDPDTSTLFYKRDVEGVRIQERLFFKSLKRITRQYLQSFGFTCEC